MSTNRDYSPVEWNKYFEKKEIISVGNSTNSLNCCVYQNGSVGPLLVFIHGGGFSALTWAVLAKILAEKIECQVLAYDIRGHGDTMTSDDADLSISRLCDDLVILLGARYPQEQPPVVLIGHSLGGAIAVKAANQVSNLQALIVIDVVEGSAMAALSSMRCVIQSRPSSFPSLSNAIEWAVRQGHVRNVEAARVSMPGQLKRREESNGHEVGRSKHCSTKLGDIPESDDSRIATRTSSTSDSSTKATTYTWRVDLTTTEPYWADWFRGLSSQFLSQPCPKLLLAAGLDRLDKELTIGQMQGRFQFQVLPKSGHCIQEDTPEALADVITQFITRFKLTKTKAGFTKSMPCC